MVSSPFKSTPHLHHRKYKNHRICCLTLKLAHLFLGHPDELSNGLPAFSALNLQGEPLRCFARGAIAVERKGGTTNMLRSGLILLLTSSVGVTLRSFEIIDPTEIFKIVCSLTSFASIACFLATYYVMESHHSSRQATQK
jgi:hypothetical protein